MLQLLFEATNVRRARLFEAQKVNSFLAFEQYFRSMKVLLYTAFILGFISAKAQFVYLSAPEEFVIGNANDKTEQKAVWLFFKEGTSKAEIILPSGKKLMRYFNTDLPNPYYIIENNQVRYRPNMPLAKADTLSIKSASPTKSAAIEEVVFTEWDSILASVKSLAYEWEKTERIKAILSSQKTSCHQQVDLLRCLHYDASRLEIVNKSSINQECLPMLEEELAPAFRNMIIKR